MYQISQKNLRYSVCQIHMDFDLEPTTSCGENIVIHFGSPHVPVVVLRQVVSIVLRLEAHQ